MVISGVLVAFMDFGSLVFEVACQSSVLELACIYHGIVLVVV